jgi:MFS family permease
MRAALGAFQGSFEPAAFSIVADDFQENDRPLANSILTTAPFVGGGLTAFNVMLIAAVGWRATINIMGAIGVAFGLLSLLLMQEPKRIQ